MQKTFYYLLLVFWCTFSRALAADIFPELLPLRGHSVVENRFDHDLPLQNLLLKEHLESKKYYCRIKSKIEDLVSRLDEGIELADSLYKVFLDRLDDSQKIMNDASIPIEKFYITALNDFKGGAYPASLTHLFQELYLSYQYECLTAHYFNRSYLRTFMCTYGLGSSRSHEALGVLEKVINHLENVRIDAHLLGQVAACEICSQKISPLSAISDRIAKMKNKQKTQFFQGMCYHILCSYFHRSLSYSILEYANVRSSHKRDTLEQVNQLAILSGIRLEDNLKYELDLIQKERFESHLTTILKRWDNLVGWAWGSNAESITLETQEK